ncbi:MAG: hypothetical protein SFV22_13580, partial [Saprospiraceae bacterium]|nr:hypothetical protein [Saprospiraceae bacterium]
AIAARGVALPPDFSATRNGTQLNVTFNTAIDTHTIRIAVRSTTTDWDTVFTVSPAFSDELSCPDMNNVYVSVAGVDAWGAESLFSGEKQVTLSGAVEPERAPANYELYQNRPNPFDEATWISFWVNEMPPAGTEALIQISDLNGRLIQNLPVALKQGLNEVLYTHGYGVRGAFNYALLVGGRLVDARQMIFAN